jgi:hypothetical protein
MYTAAAATSVSLRSASRSYYLASVYEKLVLYFVLLYTSISICQPEPYTAVSNRNASADDCAMRCLADAATRLTACG